MLLGQVSCHASDGLARSKANTVTVEGAQQSDGTSSSDEEGGDAEEMGDE